jgi:histone acetyltransferase (RNA polymerase elongator complex component)
MCLNKNHYIIPIFVPHEGCPHSCVFCNQNTITGERNVVDSQYVRDTIETYLNTIPSANTNTIEVSFYGGTFTAINITKQKALLAVAQEYKLSSRINYIRLSTRPDYINKYILEHLRSFDVDIIELGIQSLDDDVLIKSGRGHTRQDAFIASNLIRESGFILGHQIMIGLPGDNEEKDVKTVEDSIDMKPDLCRIYPALVLKDTYMERLFLQNKYEPYSLKRAVEVTKLLYCKLIAEGIKVIRIGLQTTDAILPGRDIIAGPYHPAFRELVEGSLYCQMILDYIKSSDTNYSIAINSKDISKLYANKKEFFNDIKQQCSTRKLVVNIDDSLQRSVIMIKNDENARILSLNDFIIRQAKEGKINNS